MVNSFAFAKAALETLYSGRCDVINQAKVKDPVTKQTSLQDVTVASNVPCRISYSSIAASDIDSGVAVKKQVIKLFCSPDTAISAGAKIIVTQNGVTKTYKAASEPAMYSSHLECELTLEGVYA